MGFVGGAADFGGTADAGPEMENLSFGAEDGAGPDDVELRIGPFVTVGL